MNYTDIGNTIKNVSVASSAIEINGYVIARLALNKFAIRTPANLIRQFTFMEAVEFMFKKVGA